MEPPCHQRRSGDQADEGEPDRHQEIHGVERCDRGHRPDEVQTERAHEPAGTNHQSDVVPFDQGSEILFLIKI